MLEDRVKSGCTSQELILVDDHMASVRLSPAGRTGHMPFSFSSSLCPVFPELLGCVSKLITPLNFTRCGYQPNLDHAFIYGRSKDTSGVKKSSCHAAIGRDLWPTKQATSERMLLLR